MTYTSTGWASPTRCEEKKKEKKGRRVRPNSNVLDVRPTTIKVEPGLREIIRK